MYGLRATMKWRTGCSPGRPAETARLKFAPIDSPLPARLFHRDLHPVDSRRRKFLPHSAANLFRDVFGQKLGARVDQRQKNHVAARQEQALLLVNDFHLGLASRNSDG